MAVKSKAKTIYVCTQCGCEAPKWQGKCPDCGSWNTFVEETRITGGPAAKAAGQAGFPGAGQDHQDQKDAQRRERQA